MIFKLKNNFKYINKNNNKNKFLNINKCGNKIYFNTINDIYFKKNYKFNKFVYGYKYYINSCNFNSWCLKFVIIDKKKSKEYVNCIKYLNAFNNNIIFLK